MSISMSSPCQMLPRVNKSAGLAISSGDEHVRSADPTPAAKLWWISSCCARPWPQNFDRLNLLNFF
jgi:hypothetical protein